MAPITHTVEIARAPEDVFAYLEDLRRHGEWQPMIERVHVDTDGPTRVGTRATEWRKVPGGTREFQYEVTEHEPPRVSAFRTLNGPIRPVGRITIDPVGGCSRYTMELDFEGHGLGKLIVPLVRRDARRRLPEDLDRFQARLEGRGPAT